MRFGRSLTQDAEQAVQEPLSLAQGDSCLLGGRLEREARVGMKAHAAIPLYFLVTRQAGRNVGVTASTAS